MELLKKFGGNLNYQTTELTNVTNNTLLVYGLSQNQQNGQRVGIFLANFNSIKLPIQEIISLFRNYNRCFIPSKWNISAIN